MSRDLSPYAVSLILLRIIGCALAVWWVFDYVQEPVRYISMVERGYISPPPTLADWWQALAPKPLVWNSWLDTPLWSVNIIAHFAIAAYLLIGGKALARFIARGTHRPGCEQCGYPTIGLTRPNCPECGTIVHSRAA